MEVTRHGPPQAEKVCNISERYVHPELGTVAKAALYPSVQAIVKLYRYERHSGERHP